MPKAAFYWLFVSSRKPPPPPHSQLLGQHRNNRLIGLQESQGIWIDEDIEREIQRCPRQEPPGEEAAGRKGRQSLCVGDQAIALGG